MAAYLWLLALPPLLALGRRTGPRWERWAMGLTWIALTLFFGLRREVGADWDNYLLMHARAGAHPLAEAATLGDPAFMLISGIAFRLGFALPAANLVCAAIFAAGLVLLVRAQRSPPLALIVALPVLIAIVAVTPRQSAAIGLLMASLATLRSGRPRSAALIVAAAPAFHWTAILLLPLVPAMLWRSFPSRLAIIAGAAGGLLLAALLGLTPFGDRFDHVGESAGAPLRAGLNLLALGVLAVKWNSLDLDGVERRAAACLAAIGLFALALVPVLSTAADRLGYYAIPLQVMVLPCAALALPSAARRHAAQAGIAFVYVGLFLAWLAFSPYRGCLIPYRSYLADPAAMRSLDPEVHRGESRCVARTGSAAVQSRSTPRPGTPGSGLITGNGRDRPEKAAGKERRADA